MKLKLIPAAVLYAVMVIPTASQAADKLNVLCAADNDWCEVMRNAFEKETKVEVSMVRKSAGEIFAQIRAEASNPKTDIWWAGTGDPHLQAAADGFTEVYKSPQFDKLQPWAQKQAEISGYRTVGIYEPTAAPERAPQGQRVDVAALVKDYRGDAAAIQVFEPLAGSYCSRPFLSSDTRSPPLNRAMPRGESISSIETFSMKFPESSYTAIRLLPVSVTYTRSPWTATSVGLESSPSYSPFLPNWSMNVPFSSNFWTRLFPESTTYIRPPASKQTPSGP